jgi:hypothetical protein
LGTAESRSEILGNFLSVVLEKAGKDQQGRSCDKDLLRKVREGIKQNKEG